MTVVLGLLTFFPLPFVWGSHTAAHSDVPSSWPLIVLLCTLCVPWPVDLSSRLGAV